MTNPALLGNLTDVAETSLLLGAWYTDANKYYLNDNDKDKVITNICTSATTLFTTIATTWLQRSAMERLGRYTNKFQPSTPAASAGYAMARIISNRGEGILKNEQINSSYSGGNIRSNGKESAIALAGSIAIFAMQILSNKTNKFDFASSFLLGISFGFCKPVLDLALFAIAEEAKDLAGRIQFK
ncbi:MAG: hypothetical protein ChlgKO_09510 [Chlamydiales bacterium]